MALEMTPALDSESEELVVVVTDISVVLDVSTEESVV